MSQEPGNDVDGSLMMTEVFRSASIFHFPTFSFFFPSSSPTARAMVHLSPGQTRRDELEGGGGRFLSSGRERYPVLPRPVPAYYFYRAREMGGGGADDNSRVATCATFLAIKCLLATHAQWGGYHWADFSLSKPPSLKPARGHPIEKI